MLALGAILAFAVHADSSGLSLPTVGLIFMMVGAVGFGVSIYRDRWRRHIVEESVERRVTPPIMFEDDMIIEREPAKNPTAGAAREDAPESPVRTSP
ncbi:hypothetical protein [Frankia sp. CiP1_Cm_nod2]